MPCAKFVLSEDIICVYSSIIRQHCFIGTKIVYLSYPTFGKVWILDKSLVVFQSIINRKQSVLLLWGQTLQTAIRVQCASGTYGKDIFSIHSLLTRM